jgi:hypothetical protein
MQSEKRLSNATFDAKTHVEVVLVEFVNAASTSDIPAGGMKGVKIGSEVILIAGLGGKYYAISGLCTHR